MPMHLCVSAAAAQDKQLRVSALHCAAIGGHPAVTELLIKAGADLRLRDGVRIVP